MATGYDVFLSYRQAESKDLAEEIYESLRRTRHPIANRAVKVFWDEAVIQPGQNIHVTVERAMRSSTCFVVLLTPTYSRTEYTAFEHMIIASTDWGGLQERIVPILVNKCEIPERLRAIRYLDFTGYSADQRPSQWREIVRMHCLEMPQSHVADVLAAELGISDRMTRFRFSEETGDLTDLGSYLELRDGTRVTLTFGALHEALQKAAHRVAEPFLNRGFALTACVVEGFKRRWDEETDGLPADVPILVLVEKLTVALSQCTDVELADALLRYAFDLPPDLDRSFLNSMPSPSPTTEILTEMVAREAWSTLKGGLRDVASLEAGIAVFWLFEIVRMRDRIKDGDMASRILAAQPEDPNRIRTWAEALAVSWLGVVPEGNAGADASPDDERG